MIEISRSTQRPPLVVRILGVGGAGCEVLDRLILDGIEGVSVIALNTDVQSLNASVAPEKLHLGTDITRGLGTGGDPEVGYSAAEEAAGSIQAAVAGANMIFVCVGLGGGTGSGAAPLVAHYARQAGATVVTFATMPFSFEGKRRAAQAQEALAQMREQSDLVVCFENDRMGEASAPTAGVQQAFVATDVLLSNSIRAIVSMVRGRGLVEVGLPELASALRQRDSRCLFGHGESDGANRAHEALERALKSPLMDRGRMLADAHTVLVQVTGGADLTLNEVTILMNEFNRHVADTTRIQFGLTTDVRMGRRLAVTIVSSTSARVEVRSADAAPVAVSSSVSVPVRPEPLERPESIVRPETVTRPQAAPVEEDSLFAFDGDEAPEEEGEAEELELEPEPVAVSVAKVRAPAPKAEPMTAKASPRPAADVAKKEQKAEQMPLEAPSRGRFDKGEPTIVDGQDLDVPTFMRRNVKLK